MESEQQQYSKKSGKASSHNSSKGVSRSAKKLTEDPASVSLKQVSRSAKSKKVSCLPEEKKMSRSAEMLMKLAKPSVFPVPYHEKFQTRVVERLEEHISLKIKEGADEKSFAAAYFIGAIELTEPLTDDVGDLISRSRLIDLTYLKKGQQGEHKLTGQAVGLTLFEATEGVEKEIIANTLLTMEAANQLDYLREKKLINENWKVIVETHYYRDRDIQMTGLHKDTLGQTLFVNLNFHNAETVSGPEFVINPETTVDYDRYVSGNFPKGLLEDFEAVKDTLPVAEGFGASIIKPYGVVAFTDELIHHKTPMVKHRTISAKPLSDRFPQVFEAYERYKKKTDDTLFADYLEGEDQKYATPWLKLLTKLDKEEVSRVDLAGLFSEERVNELIEGEWSDSKSAKYFQFGSASIPNVANRQDVTAKKRFLKRQMSELLLNKETPNPSLGRRTFFRTWVRLVPTLSNPEHTVSAFEIAEKNPEILKAYTKFSKQWGWGKKGFDAFLKEKDRFNAPQWLEVMEHHKNKQKRFYTKGLALGVRDTLK